MGNYKITSTLIYIKGKYGDEILDFARMASNKLTERDLEILLLLFEACKGGDDFDETEFWASLRSRESAGTKKESEEILKKRRNRLLKTIERYLAFKEFETARPIADYLVARHYIGNNNEKHAQSILRRMEKNLEKGAYWSPQMEVLFYWFLDLKIQLDKHAGNIIEFLSELENRLNHFYAINQMRIFLAKVGARQRLGLKKTDLIQLLQQSNQITQDHPRSKVIQLCDDLIKMGLTADDASYLQARQVFEQMVKKEPKFSANFKKEVTDVLMNYCIHKINAGHKEYAEYYICHFDDLEKMGQLLEVNGKIGFQRLKNGLVASLVAQDYDWFNQLRKRYGHHINEELSEEKENPLLSFLIATYELHRMDGAIHKGMTALNVFKNSKHYRKDPIHKVSADKLMIKFFFQTQNFISFEKGISALENYMRRKKTLTNRYKEAQQKTLDYFKKNASTQYIKITDKFKGLPIPDKIWIQKVNQNRGRPTTSSSS